MSDDAARPAIGPPPARLRLLLPYAGIVVTTLCWAGNWVVGRAIRGEMPPVALNFWRWTVALVVLAPFALPRLAGKGEVLRRRWLLIFALSATGVVAFQVLAYLGLRSTETVNAVLLNSAAPLFIILCAWLVDRDRVSPWQFLGMLASFLGIVVIIERGDLLGVAHFRFALGDLVILAAMPCWGIYCVLLKRRPRELDGLGLLFALSFAGVLMLAPMYAAETLLFKPATLSLASVGAALYVGLFASLLAYVCWNYGVAQVGPNRSGFLLHLLPAFGTLLAVVFLGESVHLYHFVGIGLIITGVVIASSARMPVR
jgi:drug/metabolite transporter (DMT)-like permease